MSAIALPQQLGVSSFGAAHTTTGPSGFSSRSLFESERFRELDRRQSYYECTQHDLKRFDFDGRIISAGGMSATQPLLSGEKFAGYVPLKARRPSAPYRLAKVVVDSFTNMLFGEQRFPSFKAIGDRARQDWVQAAVRSTQLPVRMVRARNIGGSVGTVGLSWAFVDGKPRVEVHNGKNLFVHSWWDRELLIPRHVSEVYLYSKDEWDNDRKRFARNWYWYRRDWTPNEDILFKEVRYVPREEPIWEPDIEGGRSVAHNDGVTHFEWIQNLPSEEIDGLPDYDGLYDTFDSIDTLNSVIVRGATLNLDPTLMLKMDVDQVQRMGVKKGSDNALAVGKDGDASYLELAGGSIQAGQELLNALRRAALETAQCVVPDPNEVASQGVSSVTIRALYAPMLGKSDIHREQYGTPMCRMLMKMADVALARSRKLVTIFDDEGNEMQAQQVVVLPPRIDRKPILDEEGNPTDAFEEVLVERDPGRDGSEVEPQWGPYFLPTPDDLSKMATVFQTTTGGKAIQSKQSAVEQLAVFMGREPEDEWARVQATHREEADAAASMFGGGNVGDSADGGVGGKVEHIMQLPSGATVRRSRDFAAEKAMAASADSADVDSADVEVKAPPSVSVGPQDMAIIVTVNEARASAGLPPVDGPEGEMTLAEYKAMRAKLIATASNASTGKVGAVPANPQPGAGGPPGAPPPGGRPGFPPKPGFPPHPGAPAGGPMATPEASAAAQGEQPPQPSAGRAVSPAKAPLPPFGKKPGGGAPPPFGEE